MSDSEQPIVSQHRVWDDWAQADPLWAILSDPSQKGGKWDIDEFFATGQADVASLQSEIAQRGLTHGAARCMDFGCGVGRLTQALAEVFTHSDGVDISETMVDLARGYNQHGEACSYWVNQEPDLSLFDDGTFDLIYSTLVLQHNPPDIAERYISEFARILAPGGLAVFDMPAALIDDTRRLTPGSHRARLTVDTAPGTLQPGEAAPVQVTVTNISQQAWPERHQVRLGNHWLDAETAVVVARDDGRTLLPGEVAPGHSVPVTVTITGPAQPGRYRLELDLVEEGVAWFADLGGAPPISRELTVRAAQRGGRLAKLTGKLRPGGTGPDTSPAEPEPFGMNALPPAAVQAAVERHGCAIADRREADSAGPQWETYRYFVAKPA